MTPSKSDNDIVKQAGRGVIYITLAKIWFMLLGYVVFFSLPRIFKWSSGGDPDQGQALFGAYKIVFMGVSFINNGIITGTIQAVSKFTSEDEPRAGAVRRTGLRVQGGLGLIIAIVYIGFARLLAGALGSPDLAFLMRLSAGIIVAYSCYAVFIGSLNGRRIFSGQALFDISYTTLKSLLIIGFAAAGFEVLGTVLGFLIAAIIIAVAAGIYTRGDAGTEFPARRYLSFATVLVLYTFLLNLVMSLDLFLLKGITAHLTAAAGANPEQASSLSKMLAGRYGAAQGLAFIPYQAILSIAFVAFPMISKVTFANDEEKTRAYIRSTLRFTLILIVGLASVFAALPFQCLDLMFEAEYLVAAEALSTLSLGIAAFGMLVISNTVLNSAGFAWHSMAIIGVTLAAVIAAVTGILFAVGPGDQALHGAALGTTLGIGLGLVVAAAVVRRQFGTFWPWPTALRVVISAAFSIALGRLVLPHAGKVATLGECILVLLVYFASLALLREFSRQDVNRLRTIMKKS